VARCACPSPSGKPKVPTTSPLEPLVQGTGRNDTGGIAHPILINNKNLSVIARKQRDRGNLMINHINYEIATSVLKNYYLVPPRNDKVL